ncbi:MULTISPECIES: hypothetical protein [Actinoalloteichus]|nr:MULTISPECIES: hypothetical protein [Actinoalloteichus]
MSNSPASQAGLPRTRALNWPLIIGLAAIALIRPLFGLVGLMDLFGRPATPILLFAGISIAWILLVGLTGVARPVLTLVLAGLIYALVSMVVAGDPFSGAVAAPVALLGILLTDIVWGAVCGVLAAALQRVRRAG